MGGLMSGLGAACCFVALESLNGPLPDFVRHARDHVTSNTAVCGYRWLSSFLLPFMVVSPAVKLSVNTLMVKPLLKAGEDKFGTKKSFLGKCLRPVAYFWFGVWSILGLTVGRNCRGKDKIATTHTKRNLLGVK